MGPAKQAPAPVAPDESSLGNCTSWWEGCRHRLRCAPAAALDESAAPDPYPLAQSAHNAMDGPQQTRTNHLGINFPCGRKLPQGVPYYARPPAQCLDAMMRPLLEAAHHRAVAADHGVGGPPLLLLAHRHVDQHVRRRAHQAAPLHVV